MSESFAPAEDTLKPLRYHTDVVAYLCAHEQEVWSWARSAEAEKAYLDQMRTMLLKQCYRLDAETHTQLHEQCARVAGRLGIAAPITIYQGSGDAGMNATLYYAPGEAHVVFSGAVLSRLQGAELEAVLGHELAHFSLWERDGHDHLAADRVLGAAANDPRAATGHLHTARRHRLYTEIYADRGAFVGCGQLEPAVSALVKMATGLPEVSASGYLRQADELFAKGERGGQGLEHPEMFVRARALRLWVDGDASLDEWLADEIEGESSLDTLCLVGQQRLTQLTRRVVEAVTHPSWMRTPALLQHAVAYFADFRPATSTDATLRDELQRTSDSHRDFWCYLLLDFASVDRELDELPLAHALTLSGEFGFQERFEGLVLKELGLSKRQLARIRKEAPELLRKAAAP